LKVYFGIEEFLKGKKIVATIGTFDGVHLGHKKILQNLIEKATQTEGESLLLTFFPHPRMVLFPENNDLKLLNTQNEKIELLDQLGLDHLIIHPFTREFSRLTSTEFVRDILVNQIGISELVIGYDHHFGRNREGSFTSLNELSDLYNFKLSEIEAQEIDSINISSTKTRNALLQGNISLANEYLGYNYRISGKVKQGQQLGRTLGYPTANIEPKESHKLIPNEGAYAVLVNTPQGEFKGMLNIGKRPTVSSGNATSIEVHIFDFNFDLYNQEISVEFVKRIRDEKKFESKEELKQQLAIDENKCLAVLA
jgi:riboflavin kinase/FMN adenylyltransferase